jgi:hypothetical protein
MYHRVNGPVFLVAINRRKELLAGLRDRPEPLCHCGYDRFGTWAFATLAWTYFFSTVISSLPIAALLRFFMGGMILTIDRALIKGISRPIKKDLSRLHSGVCWHW